jgi:hypothetical protein
MFMPFFHLIFLYFILSSHFLSSDSFTVPSFTIQSFKIPSSDQGGNTVSAQRQIIQYDRKGNPLHTYSSIREAQDFFKITHISSVCRKKRKTDGGYGWKYADEESEKESLK